MKLVNIGFGNMVNAQRVVAMVAPDSAPIKRIVQDAKEKGTLIDATFGRKTKTVLVIACCVRSVRRWQGNGYQQAV